jgi:hypothetical protein
MKKVFLLATAFAFTFSAMAQTRIDDLIKFETEVHDFGKIKQAVPVTYDFMFKNISKAPVVIESATATCGCTTPVKPTEPILAGASNKITAGFNAGAPGTFTKPITIKVAGTDETKIITITGEVLSAEAYEAYLKTIPPPAKTDTVAVKKIKKSTKSSTTHPAIQPAPVKNN